MKYMDTVKEAGTSKLISGISTGGLGKSLWEAYGKGPSQDSLADELIIMQKQAMELMKTLGIPDTAVQKPAKYNLDDIWKKKKDKQEEDTKETVPVYGRKLDLD